MPVFALVDHGIAGFAGHNLTYAQRVLGAAAAGGYSTIAAVVRGAAVGGLRHEIHHVFSRDHWANNPLDRRLWNAGAIMRRLRRRRASDAPALFSNPIAAPENSPGSVLRRIRPVGRTGLIISALLDDLGAFITAVWAPPTFAKELAAFLARADVPGGSIVFLPTVKATEIRGLCLLLKRSEGARTMRWRLLLRYPADTAGSRRQHAVALKQLSTFSNCDLALFTDTDPLRLDFERISGLNFSVAPIPSPTEPTRAETGVNRRDFVVGYFGSARLEKGFTLLPAVVRECRKSQQPIHFRIQINFNIPEGERATKAALAELRALEGPDVSLVNGPLESEAYTQALRSIDLLLAPYDPAAYALRSSGIFMEGLAMGTPMVVTGGSWMADTLSTVDPYGEASYVVANDAASIAKATITAASDRERLKRAANALARRTEPLYQAEGLIGLLGLAPIGLLGSSSSRVRSRA